MRLKVIIALLLTVIMLGTTVVPASANADKEVLIPGTEAFGTGTAQIKSTSGALNVDVTVTLRGAVTNAPYTVGFIDNANNFTLVGSFETDQNGNGKFYCIIGPVFTDSTGKFTTNIKVFSIVPLNEIYTAGPLTVNFK